MCFMNFLVKHLIDYIITLFVASVIIFVVLEVLPGDPADHLAGIRSSDETVEQYREALGLNKPVVERYFNWIGSFITGDWGNSYRYQTPVFDLVIERIGVTFPLAAMTFCLIAFFGITLSILSAQYHRSTLDKSIRIFAFLGMSIPEFWLGILLIITLAIPIAFFPVGGVSHVSWMSFIQSLILPSIALAIPQICILYRYARSVFLEIKREDFVKAGYAHGFKKSFLFYKYIFPLGMIPILSLLSMQVTAMLTGTILIEKVFDIPGLGHLLFISVENRDFMIIKTLVLLFVTIIVAMHFVVDIIHRILDPRLRLSQTISSVNT